ncbi:MAG: hypothetical protein WA705_18290 [Candidatus Ozemobacteraceae bacterium]
MRNPNSDPRRGRNLPVPPEGHGNIAICRVAAALRHLLVQGMFSILLLLPAWRAEGQATPASGTVSKVQTMLYGCGMMSKESMKVQDEFILSNLPGLEEAMLEAVRSGHDSRFWNGLN